MALRRRSSRMTASSTISSVTIRPSEASLLQRTLGHIVHSTCWSVVHHLFKDREKSGPILCFFFFRRQPDSKTSHRPPIRPIHYISRPFAKFAKSDALCSVGINQFLSKSLSIHHLNTQHFVPYTKKKTPLIRCKTGTHTRMLPLPFSCAKTCK